MSFSYEVKCELLKTVPQNPCCRHAFCYGMLLFAKSFTSMEISAFSEIEDVIDLYISLLFEETGVKAQKSLTKAGKFKAKVNKDDIDKVMDAFSINTSGFVKQRIYMGNMQNASGQDEIYNCCYRAFLSGAFLCGGTVSDPEKNYHFEYITPYVRLAEDLQMVLKECEISSNKISRRNSWVVYIKHSTQIENLLNIIGAPMCELQFINKKIEKDIKNQANRANNFEFANLSRTASAFAEHANIIRSLEEHETLELLPEDLQLMAKIRMENPFESLTGLGGKFEPPISRSAVNYKLKRLKHFCKKTKDEIIQELSDN